MTCYKGTVEFTNPETFQTKLIDVYYNTNEDETEQEILDNILASATYTIVNYFNKGQSDEEAMDSITSATFQTVHC
jgi:hypothetical protein